MSTEMSTLNGTSNINCCLAGFMYTITFICYHFRTNHCTEYVMAKFKYYLVFENSLCDYYVVLEVGHHIVSAVIGPENIK